MSFATDQLAHPRPDSLAAVQLPEVSAASTAALTKRNNYTPSPIDWRDEVLYFLLVDRFSDGAEATRPKLDRANLDDARQPTNGRPAWWWLDWAQSGSDRFQGGTIAGVRSKLDYLAKLGVTTIWLSPVFRQRANLDTYHGYGVQDFLDVDPRFGTRQDLVDLVAAAHAQGIRILLDIIFNHSGHNWDYPAGSPGGGVKPWFNRDGRYALGQWLDGNGAGVDIPPAVPGPDDAVWPDELCQPDVYTRKGCGSLAAGDVGDPRAEHKLTDFEDLRDFDLFAPGVLTNLAECYKYWIALTDCDGFRIDTLKHVSKDQARNFCGTVKEYAAKLGKTQFLLLGEVAGGSGIENTYLDALPRNLDAVLEIGELRPMICNVAKGLDGSAARSFFANFEITEQNRDEMPSHRIAGSHHVLIVNDHDHVFGEKERLAYRANPQQVVTATALQLFCLGIPCLYYGTEQAFSGPDESIRGQFLAGVGGDRFLRETLFGAAHPRASGRAGRNNTGTPRLDPLPGFGPFGTAGAHCFDEQFGCYQRIAALAALRHDYAALRWGRQYQRAISYLTYPFAKEYEAGQLVAWSRLLDTEEILVVINPNGDAPRGARIAVDAVLNGEPGKTFTRILQAADGNYPATLDVKEAYGWRYVEVWDLAPAGVLVYRNS